MCWDIGDDYVFFWYDQISQKESLEWRSRGAFPALAVFPRCCDKFVAQIETFAAHIGDTTQHKVPTSTAACLSQKVSLLCHIKMFVSHNVWGPPPLLLSTHASAVWRLREAEICVRQRWCGWWGGRAYLAINPFPANLWLLSILFNKPEVWLGCRGRGRVDEGLRVLHRPENDFSEWQISSSNLFVIHSIARRAVWALFCAPSYLVAIGKQKVFNVGFHKEQHCQPIQLRLGCFCSEQALKISGAFSQWIWPRITFS